MRRTQTPVMLALAGLLTSLVMFVSPGTAAAVESAELQWPAVSIGQHSQFVSTDPKGGVTLGCNTSSSDDENVRTYNASGQMVRDLHNDACILRPAVDKNGDIYGHSNSQGDLLAYSGNTLKWRYATECSPTPVVGADGNIYSAAMYGRLIALSPSAKIGQAQPEKVRDIPLDIPLACGAEFNAFKYGLWTSSSATTFFFYSYGGKKLAEFTTARRPVPVSVNANGLLIYGNQSIVTAFDPMTNSQKWSIDLSTLSRTVSVAKLYATPDGGVVVQTSGSAPVLIKLNASGNLVREIWSKTFPSVDNDGNEFGEIQGVANGHGKLALFRSASLKTNDPATQVPAIGIAVLNVANGDLVYNKTLHGNLDTTHGGLYGYQMDGDMSRGHAIGVNTVYVRAKCAGACTDTSPKLLPIAVAGMRLDYPRGTVLASNDPMQPSSVPYVAMGDSFSSGQGAGVYDADTVTSTNRCYKSRNGYGRILSRDVSSPLMLTSFAACGGSVTDNIDINTTYPGVTQKQDQALSSNTKVVSLTIGGNDIGFTEVVTECVKASVGLGDCNAAIESARSKLQSLPMKLSRVYVSILNKTSTQNGGANAQVYVLGYAPLLSANAPDCVVNDFPFSGDNKTAVILLLNDLNKVISDAVTAADNPRIQYVNPMEMNSPFIGHSLCTTDPYFNGITGPDTSESFHPNTKGQKAYADLLAQYVLAS